MRLKMFIILQFGLKFRPGSHTHPLATSERFHVWPAIERKLKSY